MDAFLTTTGGFGFFLFGMALMVSGMKKLAGDQLHTWLAHATRTPLTGTLTGAAVTAAIQSSSATTIATVGFVGAGLLTFPQALGVVYGANIGTTITGWIVALLGLKLKLSSMALPILLIAAILYLVKSKRILRGSGKALAGFALIFIGIGFLQQGLAGARDWIDLTAFDANGLGGRFVLFIIGIALTLITQASSATVAVALTALNTGAIDLPQAGALIVGADIGTTAKAMLASIGGNAAARRTAFAHVAYNLLIGGSAFFLLPLYLWLWARLSPSMVDGSPEIIAVAYHSIYNLVGVCVMLPFTHQFARMIERLYPDRDAPLLAALDDQLLDDSRAASHALESATRRITAATLQTTAAILSGGSIPSPEVSIGEILHASAEVRAFAVKTGKAADDADLRANRLFAILHIIDHCERLAERASLKGRYAGMASHPELRALATTIARDMERLANELSTGVALDSVPALEQTAAELENDKARFRARHIAEATQGVIDAQTLENALDGARWLRRLTYHASRAGHYGAALFP